MKLNIYRVLWPVLFFFVFLPVGILSAEGTSEGASEDILAKVDKYREFSTNGFSFDLKITELNNEKEEVMEMQISVKDADKALCKYLAPKKGKFVLMRNAYFWFFNVGMNSPIRISPRQMLIGQASSGDITRIIFSYFYTIASQETLADQMVLKLIAVPKKGSTYDKITLFVKKDDFEPVKAECYSKTGILLKTIHYTDFKEIGNKKLLVGFEIINNLNDRKSKVYMDNFTNKIPPANYFNKDYMRFLK